jgi:hypothetical protein
LQRGLGRGWCRLVQRLSVRLTRYIDSFIFYYFYIKIAFICL